MAIENLDQVEVLDIKYSLGKEPVISQALLEDWLQDTKVREIPRQEQVRVTGFPLLVPFQAYAIAQLFVARFNLADTYLDEMMADIEDHHVVFLDQDSPFIYANRREITLLNPQNTGNDPFLATVAEGLEEISSGTDPYEYVEKELFGEISLLTRELRMPGSAQAQKILQSLFDRFTEMGLAYIDTGEISLLNKNNCFPVSYSLAGEKSFSRLKRV